MGRSGFDEVLRSLHYRSISPKVCRQRPGSNERYGEEGKE